MSIEKQKQNKLPARELESHHFYKKDPSDIEGAFLEDNNITLDMAKQLLFHKQAKLIIDEDSQHLVRALVKNKEGKIIFSTTFGREIDELADSAYNTK